MKITDVSQIISAYYSNVIIIDCIHEQIKNNNGNRYEIFILNKNNEQIAHFESSKCINASGLDHKCNLFTVEDADTKSVRHIRLYKIEKDKTYKYLNVYEDIQKAEDGYFVVKKNGLWGFINKKGEEVITPQYEDYYPFNNGLAEVKRNNKWGIIDRNNNIVVPLKYWRSHCFYGGYIIMETYDSTTDVYNKRGKIVYQAEKFVDVFNLGNGTLLVENKNTHEYEFIKPEN